MDRGPEDLGLGLITEHSTYVQTGHTDVIHTFVTVTLNSPENTRCIRYKGHFDRENLLNFYVIRVVWVVVQT